MNEPTADDLKRDLAADLAWVIGDTVCLTTLTAVVASAALRRAIAAEAIINAPRVMLFADGRNPTKNERHLFNLLCWREKEAGEAKEEAARLRGIIEGLSDRVAVQAELLSRRAEDSPSCEDVRALVIEMRRHVLAHGVLIGECVAWDRLKKLTGVGQDENCPSEK